MRHGCAMLLTAVVTVGAVVIGLSAVVGAQSSRGCGKFPISSGLHTITVQDPLIGKIDRTYRVYVPKNYDRFVSTPMVIDFHGYYDTGPIQEEESGVKSIADDYNFIAVWPNGLDDTVVPGFDAYSWNAVGTVGSPGPDGDTCKWNAAGVPNGYPCHSSCKPTRGCRTDRRAASCDCSTCADDVLFITSMLDKLESELCIDTGRVFLTGMSNGAMMVYELVTHSASVAKRFAAVAPVAGSPLLGFGKNPSVSMPIMEIHGATDNIIPANKSGSYRGESCPGNPLCAVSSDGFYYELVDSTINRFAKSNRCTDNGPVHYRTEFDGLTGLYCVAPHGMCGAGSVIRCSWQGGHTWPFGNGAANRRRYALLIWEFFTVAGKVANGHSASLRNVSTAHATSEE